MIWPMKQYIQRQKANIAEYIENHPIYELCTGVERMPGLNRLMWWWDQELNLDEEGDVARESFEREVG